MDKRIIDIVHDIHLSSSEKWEKVIEMFKNQEHINVPLIEFLGKRFEVPEDEVKETVINLVVNKVKKELKIISEAEIKKVVIALLPVLYDESYKNVGNTAELEEIKKFVD
ncbi:hypothetical protein SAMN04324257_00158 [Thermoanaerobacter thermohydrosulfuricus]|nr:hypothetical protein SAMN04324257_00158 [Thermoanaerobacter thermohydrosulfuricus]